MSRSAKNTTKLLTVLGACALATLGAMSAQGCRGQRTDKPPRQFLPDMDDQAKWHPQGESDFFADGRTMRPRVTGTVAFGTASNDDWGDRDRCLKEDSRFYRGVDDAGDYINTIPVPVTADLIKRGQQRFNIYCSACHGFLGDGQGTVGLKWSYPLPSFHDAKYKDPAQRTGKDGYLFHTIRNGVIDAQGVQKMPSYGHAVSEQDAWAIVSYLRALQATHVPVDEVPPEVRSKLKDSDRPEPAPATPVDASGGQGSDQGGEVKP